VVDPGVDDPNFPGAFQRFAQAVRDHAEAEERTILPPLLHHLDARALETMRGKLVAAQAIAPTHPRRRRPKAPWRTPRAGDARLCGW
jgi:hypothetical protein